MLLNRFCQGLAQVCRERPLEEKWLLAPSRRVGRQWIDAVAMSGQAAVNARVETMASLALKLAGPGIAARKLTPLTGRGGEILIDRLWTRLHDPESGYLLRLPSSPSLSRTVLGAIMALRLADVDARRLRPDVFEVARKGQELTRVLDAYAHALRERRLVDRADILRMAAERLRHEPAWLENAGAFLVFPADREFARLERGLIEAFPQERRLVLAVDEPEPGDRPDQSVALFHAVGEANEVREVLRRCLAQGAPLDEVELLYTDSETYVPLVYEISQRFRGDNGAGLPVTFAEGVPARYSRPGRALMAWLSWARQGFPQESARRMIQDGLLAIGGMEREAGGALARLAALLRSVPIGQGRARYDAKIAQHIEALEARLADPAHGRDEDGEERPAWRDHNRQRIEGLRGLRDFFTALLEATPDARASQGAILEAAIGFLERFARHDNEFDNYARQRLVLEIRELASWLAQDEEEASVNVWDWLAALPGEATVEGRAPQPGHLHVAPALGGGHSGRRHTFIVGLDDARFPGAGSQDPLLLDAERKRISGELKTSSEILGRKIEDFARLLARLRGDMTLSYASWNVQEDREQFPCAVMLAAYRLISGDREGDQAALGAWLGAPVSFAPMAEDRASDETEWWLWRLCARDGEGGREGRPMEDGLPVWLERLFPHLARGAQAARRRAGEAFSEFDGRVPLAGRELDPLRPGAAVMSSHGLETVGACPLRFFFRYGLEVQPPEEREIDPNEWLDAAQAGSLLHEVFRDFMDELIKERLLPPDRARDMGRMERIVADHVSRAREMVPPPNESVFLRQRRQLEQTARVFLIEEERHERETRARPVFLEASLGMPSEDARTPLDTPQPVVIPLGEAGGLAKSSVGSVGSDGPVRPVGPVLRARGRIDRIDRSGSAGAGTPPSRSESYEIWDYKTGGSWKQTKDPPFWQGRVIQNALYYAMAQQVLREKVSAAAEVTQFGYFFPGVKTRGDRKAWSAQELETGGAIIQRLCRIVAGGAFVATDNSDDCKYCDYARVCRDVEAVAAASGRKLENPANEALAAFAELRRKE